MLGVAIGGEAEERVDRREAGVAGLDAAAAVVLQVLEERADQRGVEVLEVELRRRLAGPLLRKAEQQPEGVAVCGDGVRAGVAARCRAASVKNAWRVERACSWLALLVPLEPTAASASSSGAADRYQ